MDSQLEAVLQTYYESLCNAEQEPEQNTIPFSETLNENYLETYENSKENDEKSKEFRRLRIREVGTRYVHEHHHLLPGLIPLLSKSQHENDDKNLYTIICYLFEFLTNGDKIIGHIAVNMTIEQLMSENIVQALVDLALLDRFYSRNHEDENVKREVLSRVLTCLSTFFRAHQRRAEYQRFLPPLPLQDAVAKVPQILLRIWQARHYLLPVPAESEPTWDLSDEDPIFGVDELELSMVCLVVDYSSVFSESRDGSPKFVLEGSLLHIHGLTRTKFRRHYNICVKVLGIFSRDEKFLRHVARVWNTAMDDPVLCQALMRQLSMRLRDEIVDRDVEHILCVILNFCTLTTTRQTPYAWSKLLCRVTRALERQKCMGMITEGLRFSDIVATGLGILSVLFIPSKQNSAGYQGDISKLDLVGVLAYFTPAAVEYPDSIPVNALADIVNRYAAIATEYIARGADRKIERLRYRAVMCVPQILQDLKRMTPPARPPRGRIHKHRALGAWTNYAIVLGVSEAVDLADLPEPPPMVIRTCAYPACLCTGKTPGHRLRICTGCYLVYYCNGICQGLDWNQGGHAERCKRLCKRPLGYVE